MIKRFLRLVLGFCVVFGSEYGLRAEGNPSVVAGEQGLEFADDLIGSGFLDQVGFDFETA